MVDDAKQLEQALHDIIVRCQAPGATPSERTRTIIDVMQRAERALETHGDYLARTARDGPVTRHGRTFPDYDAFLDWKWEQLEGWEDSDDDA